MYAYSLCKLLVYGLMMKVGFLDSGGGGARKKKKKDNESTSASFDYATLESSFPSLSGLAAKVGKNDDVNVCVDLNVGDDGFPSST